MKPLDILIPALLALWTLGSIVYVKRRKKCTGDCTRCRNSCNKP